MMAPTPTDVEGLATLLRDAYTSGVVPPVRDQIAAGDVASAYAVQQHNTGVWVKAGRRIVGRKIGLTNPVVQRQLGVDQPDFGVLFDDMAYGDGEEVPTDAVLQPKVEAEVALVMATDLELKRPTMAELISAVAYALPAIEIVGSRIAGWDIDIRDTVADNASSGLFVLGGSPKLLTDIDLREVRMTMTNGDETVSTGTGASCLGHPLVAGLWLARTLAAMGDPLRAGDVVLTGALGPMVTADPGRSFEATITSLGSVRTRFSR